MQDRDGVLKIVEIIASGGGSASELEIVAGQGGVSLVAAFLPFISFFPFNKILTF